VAYLAELVFTVDFLDLEPLLDFFLVLVLALLVMVFLAALDVLAEVVFFTVFAISIQTFLESSR
jgi:hypothetical protein